MSDSGRFVLFGHPVSHSWSPFIHGLFARQFGHEVEYHLVDVEAADFRKVALDLGLLLDQVLNGRILQDLRNGQHGLAGNRFPLVLRRQPVRRGPVA
jgi:hypothetical protein